jgi:hypothetical protein
MATASLLALGAFLTGRAQTAPAASPPAAAEPGLLFYLSGEKGTTADVAAPGTSEPTFVAEVSKIADGAKGAALECGDYQRLAYTAPGNIYAQRGTLSFFWRSRYPVGPTAFPIFRVAFADHSSWDQVWLRIDYNGHGFDAFVTDASLSRVRVSVPLEKFPDPKTWTHLALAWDETTGIRFYVNGKLAAEDKTPAVLNVALDQFGPHSRIISSWQVQSDYNFTRGGDLDELRIYDRAVGDAAVATLAKGDTPTALAQLPSRSLADKATRDEWYLRYGFNNPLPALPDGKFVSIRKVEIHEAYDLKRWWWKANDGIRETTWPGVYNRSRLPGRNDYFQLPDWDCYVDSGKAVSFQLPNEPWNHLEISGAAWGKMELLKPGSTIENAYAAPAESVLFERAKGQEHTVHTVTAHTGGQIRFTNVEQEQPIGELAAYHVSANKEPAGSTKRVYRLESAQLDQAANFATLAPLTKFVAGRFAPDERAALIAQPSDAGTTSNTPAAASGYLPLVHILVPDTWDQLTDGLDGIAIDLPALKVKPTHGALFPLNIRVSDPLWPLRDMLDVTFSVKPGEAKTLWLDLRDRILPEKKGFLISISGAGSDFNAAALVGAELRLVFKPREAARPEHEIDRFTQAKDTYAMLVEEHPNSPKLAMWARFKGDLDDLLRVNPDHVLGQQYAAAAMPMTAPRPKFTQPAPPDGVPLWAFRQTYLLGQVKHFVEYYIDHRQSDFGDFGGGISDDVDLLNTWPGVALMGVEPEKIKLSNRRLLDAAFKNGMFTNGLPTIQADELHSYEEGINCLAQNLIVDFGNPQQLERAMDTARGLEWLSGINAAGHRHIKSAYYSGNKMAEEHPWGWAKPYSYLVCQVPQLLVDFNGSPAAKKVELELTDGLLAHRHVGENGRATLATAIKFADDSEGDYGRGYFPWHMFWASWKWTGDKKYLAPILEGGSAMQVNANVLDLLDLRKDWAARNAPAEGGRRNPNAGPGELRPGNRAAGFRGSSGEHFAWQNDGDKAHLERVYGQQIESCAVNEYIETEGSLWIDRVGAPTTELQRARLGGVALIRNGLYPGHAVSWQFATEMSRASTKAEPVPGESVAILVPNATQTSFKVIAYNLETKPVYATMTGWNVDPGVWTVTQGIDTNNDDVADGPTETSEPEFGRSQSIEIKLPPRATTILTLKLKTPGTPYWSRPDLGISAADISRQADGVHVRVHSLGSVAAPPSMVVLRDTAGQIIDTVQTPAIAAPNDLQPKTAEIVLKDPQQRTLKGGRVGIFPNKELGEITELNNSVQF